MKNLFWLGSHGHIANIVSITLSVSVLMFHILDMWYVDGKKNMQQILYFMTILVNDPLAGMEYKNES